MKNHNYYVRSSRTYSNNYINNNVRTDLHAYSLNRDLIIPEQFDLLAPDQKRDVLLALQRLKPDVQQQVMDEWYIRCLSGAINNPVGYLFGIIKKARINQFRPNTASSPLISPPQEAIPPTRTEPRNKEDNERELSLEERRERLKELREKLKI